MSKKKKARRGARLRPQRRMVPPPDTKPVPAARANTRVRWTALVATVIAAVATYAAYVTYVAYRANESARKIPPVEAAASAAANYRARYAYVHGVALHSTGKHAEAIRLLADAHRRFTGDAEILQALATMERDRGNRDAARTHARKLDDLSPDDPQAKNLLRQIER